MTTSPSHVAAGRALIVTADDLGLDPAVNTAVAELVGHSPLTALSLLTTGPHAEATVAAKAPLAVGVHVALDLTWLKTADDGAIASAIDAQIAWLTERDVQPTHLDLHLVALYGLGPHAPPERLMGVVPQALEAAGRHGLAFRVPRFLPPVHTPPGFRERHAQVVQRADELGVRIPSVLLAEPGALSQIRSYDDLHQAYLTLLTALPDGVSELVLHPCTSNGVPGDDEAMARRRRWEDRLLRSGDLALALEEEGIELTHW